ncbi:hypothetical protein K2173_020745 [Erythroxylum novogranatense]|uniref:Leucine-rich repeat-containing N-terminal plant-type domain-containing protein n=1 Tax=Erythroxylum novogranatense TaxID=1862640 RepID=A0AAV8TPA8_9ROSI|nr:hypothetical protein K2173_020745 [Erythroxylum novogranatense]
MVRTIKLWVVTIIVTLEGWFHDIGYGCLEHERQALLELRTSFSAPHARFLSSWGIEADCCYWDGVKCDQSTRRVIGLDLSPETDFINTDSVETDFIETDWYINASLFLPFEELSDLSLEARDIVGCVENEGFERLSKLGNLETLVLSSNKFNNSILPSLSHLPSLLSLDLSNNRLNGKIDPKDLNNLTSLEELDLGFNEIEGFKSVLGDEETLELSNLEYLDLSYNHFDNNVLSYLSGLPSLVSLDISNNRIKGSIDVTELVALSQLQELNLGGNAITEFVASRDAKNGSNLVALYLDSLTKNVTEVLLQSLSEFPNLGTLTLTSNNIVQGEIFNRGFPYLKYLEILDLSSSILHDSVLQTMEKLTSLHSLNLRNCGLIGHAPQSLCELKHLQDLDVGYNNLTGILPLCMANLTSLQLLDLSNNNFGGDISPLKSLTSIQSLSLSFNHFQIPMSLSPLLNLSTLNTLDVSRNEIYTETKEQVLAPKFQLQMLLLSGYGGVGTFPRFLYHQYDLQEVDLSHLKLRGGFPHWLLENNTDLLFLSLVNNSLSGPLKLPVQSQMDLSYLQISDNDLYGQIPKEIGLQLPTLSTLEMENNGLHGTIPSSFGNMTILRWLDLANNALSGELPEQLIKGCYSLRGLRLSNNSLQGQVFPRNATVTNLEWFRLDGNQFTGSIPNSLSKSSFLIVLVASHNNLSGIVPQWLRNMSYLKVLDLSNNNMVVSLPPGFSPPNIEQVYLSSNRFQGSLKKPFHDCSKLMALDLSHNNLAGRNNNYVEVVINSCHSPCRGGYKHYIV